MPVSPDECLKLTVNEQQQVEQLIKSIDAQLREQFTSSNSLVRILISKSLNERVYNRIHTTYSVVGWQVIRTSSGGSDMRGLDPSQEYLEFTKSKGSKMSDNYQDRNTESFYDK